MLHMEESQKFYAGYKCKQYECNTTKLYCRYTNMYVIYKTSTRGTLPVHSTYIIHEHTFPCLCSVAGFAAQN